MIRRLVSGSFQRIRRLPHALFNFVTHRYREQIHMLQRASQACWHGRDLSAVQDNTDSIAPGDVLLFATLRNEAIRIPYFLEYYREIGVRHFLFVDNGSTDGFSELVSAEPDVSVWYTECSYAHSNFGMHWLNYLLRRYGCGHWCVACDPDEFLVYPHCDQRKLSELGKYLESENRSSLCCLMLDMYSDRRLADTHYGSGDNPFVIAPYFDGNGYTQSEGWLQDVYTRGGVRRRLFFNKVPEKAPALNKTPFVKWRWSYSYFLSMHQLVPAWLNQPHSDDHESPTGCLLHFKNVDLLTEKIREELVRKQHWDESFEYARYEERLGKDSGAFLYSGSIRYESWQKLDELGFLSRGNWF